jgi:hypothetical protein
VALRVITTLAVALVLSSCVGIAATATIPPELLADARARGTTRAIVEMRVPSGASEAEIEAVKRDVLAELSGTAHTVLRALPGSPILVLEASEATLQRLATSPHVLRVEAERIDRPQR